MRGQSAEGGAWPGEAIKDQDSTASVGFYIAPLPTHRKCTHTHPHTPLPLRAESMTVAQQGPLHHLCSQHITYTHYSSSLITHTFGTVQPHTSKESPCFSLSVHSLFSFHTYYNSAIVTIYHQLIVTQWTPPPKPLPRRPSWRSAMWKHCSTFLTKSIINKTCSASVFLSPSLPCNSMTFAFILKLHEKLLKGAAAQKRPFFDTLSVNYLFKWHDCSFDTLNFLETGE